MQDDIKIYEGPKKKENSEITDAVESMKEHRANGNIDRAKVLGRKLANIDLNLKELVSPKLMKPDIIYQIMVLLVFAAEVNLQTLISAPLLSATAINTMYDEIQEKSGGFYSNLCDGVAFSFYYTAFRNGGDIAEGIGRVFAMLCSVEGNDSFIEAGRKVYGEAVKVISAEIERSGFLPI